jgi:hypothetical protein
MREFHEFEPVARRAFTVTPYAADAAGMMVASMPSSCSRREAGDPPCSLSVNHRRVRKRGPLFALTVARCGLHRRAFTLYPPGHVPYGRVAIAPVSSDGALLRDAPSGERAGEQAPVAPSGERAGEQAPVAPSGERTGEQAPVAPLSFSDTVFGAAIDAAAGVAWPRKSPARPGDWRTQGRRLVRGAQLAGIAPTTADDEVRHREQMARQLGVPTLLLVEQARQWNKARGYRARGAAIALVIAGMEASRRLSDRLMRAGALGELWGRPSRWYPDAGVLHRLPFS